MSAPSVESLVLRADQEIQHHRDELISLRRHFHIHPELSHYEFETTREIARRLTDLGYEVHVRPEGTGLFADLAPPGFDPDRHNTIAVRSDIDALPIEELNDVPYRSRNDGVMHACGHDAHIATVFGCALSFAALRDELPGRVRLIYQHAEETVPGGANEMVAFGAVDGVDAVLGLHVDPELPVGQIGVKKGAFTAAFDSFTLIVRGKGGHGARPHQCVDPIFVSTQIATALYQFMGRSLDARHPSVFSLGTINGGTVSNVIPEKVTLTGSIRTIDPNQRASLEEHLHRIIGGICMAHGATYEMKIEAGAPAIFNDDHLTDVFTDVGREVLGDDGVFPIPLPSMGGEDFSFYCERVPGAMFRLGAATRAPSYFLHSPHFDIDERALSIGARVMTRAVLRLLRDGV